MLLFPAPSLSRALINRHVEKKLDFLTVTKFKEGMYVRGVRTSPRRPIRQLNKARYHRLPSSVIQ